MPGELQKKDWYSIPQEELPVPLPECASWPNQSDSLDHLFGHRGAFLLPLTWIPMRRGRVKLRNRKTKLVNH